MWIFKKIITTLATQEKRFFNYKQTKMKKIFAIKVLAFGALLTVLASCGSGRHNCPAYGNVDVDNADDVAVAE